MAIGRGTAEDVLLTLISEQLGIYRCHSNNIRVTCLQIVRPISRPVIKPKSEDTFQLVASFFFKPNPKLTSIN